MGKKIAIVLACYSILLVGLLYHQAFNLPYFFDDIDHIPFATTHSYRVLWTTAGGFPYFRPMGVTLFRLLIQIWGTPFAPAHHALNLMLHALNGWLVAWLSWQIIPRPKIAHSWLAATLFLLYPFSYQAVPWVDSIYHLLVTSLLLLALNGYIQYKTTNRPIWLGVALISAFLAPFAHENGIVGGCLIVAWLTLSPFRPKSVRAWGSELALWGMITVGAFLLWRMGVTREKALTINSAETIWQNVTYFVQGISYPFSFGRFRAWGLNDFAIVWGGFGMTTMLAIGSRGKFPLWLLIWYLAVSSLAILFLPFEYVIDGARLLMSPSVAVSIGWAILIVAWWERLQHWGGRIILIGLVGAIFFRMGIFVNHQMRLHAILGAGIDQMVEKSAESWAANRSAVFINGFAWLSQRDLTFALGHEGVMFLPNYILPQRMLEVNAGKTGKSDFFRYDDLISPLPYVGGVMGGQIDWQQLLTESADLYLMRYTTETAEAQWVGQIAENWNDSAEPFATFAPTDGTHPTILLQEAIFSADAHTLKLRWKTTAPIPPTTTIFVHLISADGKLVGQADGHPFGGMYPLSNWEIGRTLWDVRKVAGESAESIAIGVYDTATGQRWKSGAGDSVVIKKQ